MGFIWLLRKDFISLSVNALLNMKLYHGTNIIVEKPQINRFKVKELYNQVVFCNELALSSLRFVNSYKVEV